MSATRIPRNRQSESVSSVEPVRKSAWYSSNPNSGVRMLQNHAIKLARHAVNRSESKISAVRQSVMQLRMKAKSRVSSINLSVNKSRQSSVNKSRQSLRRSKSIMTGMKPKFDEDLARKVDEHMDNVTDPKHIQFDLTLRKRFERIEKQRRLQQSASSQTDVRSRGSLSYIPTINSIPPDKINLSHEENQQLKSAVDLKISQIKEEVTNRSQELENGWNQKRIFSPEVNSMRAKRFSQSQLRKRIKDKIPIYKEQAKVRIIRSRSPDLLEEDESTQNESIILQQKLSSALVNKVRAKPIRPSNDEALSVEQTNLRSKIYNNMQRRRPEPKLNQMRVEKFSHQSAL